MPVGTWQQRHQFDIKRLRDERQSICRWSLIATLDVRD